MLRLSIMLATVFLAFAACEPVKLPHEQPGPAGCGLRDPRETAPGMLSIAQKEAYRQNGAPDSVQKNKHGGLDWKYQRSVGSVFGEQQSIETLSWSAEGLLAAKDTEMLKKVGK
jgi:hypothetical protein